MENVPDAIQKFAYDIIYYVFWAVELLLFLRFILKILGANAANQIIAFIYAVSQVFMGPFVGIFPNSSVSAMQLEPSVLVAMIFYAVLAYVLVSFIKILGRVNSQPPYSQM